MRGYRYEKFVGCYTGRCVLPVTRIPEKEDKHRRYANSGLVVRWRAIWAKVVLEEQGSEELLMRMYSIFRLFLVPESDVVM